MPLKLDRAVLGRFVPGQSPDRVAMKGYGLTRRADELVVFAFLAVLLALGLIASVFGALAAPDAASFWQNLVGGIALVAVMTIPIWFVQRWRALGRRATTPQAVRASRRINLALFALWFAGLGVAATGLAIDLAAAASIEASIAVGVLLVYIVGWGILVFWVLLEFPPPAIWLRLVRLGARIK